ncbi:2-succinyl-5-enolpyruvyl-6-hydroxy-3-cyclohexene-1-carboxylate synthase, partial [Ligilactobacillus ruminis]
LYDFTFKRFDNLTDFKYAELSKMGSHMYEVITNRDENLHQHQNLYQKLSEIVNVTL